MGMRSIKGTVAPALLALALVLGAAAGTPLLPRPAAAAPATVSAAATQLVWQATSPEGAVVGLDGSASSADAVLFAWWENCGAPLCEGGTRLTEDSIDNRGADVLLGLGDHVITLLAADAGGQFAASAPITVSVVAATPVANAGPDTSVPATSPAGANVPVNGSNSTGAASYVWSITGLEVGTGPTPTIAVPLGSTEVTLTVTSAAGVSATDIVVIAVTQTLPNADAGDDQTVASPDGNGVAVTLDGSGSTNTASYAWALPGGLGSATGVAPVLTVPVGTYAVTLTATSVSGQTDTDTVQVTVTGPPQPLNADAGPDRLAYLSNGTTALVQLDGSASTGAEAYEWRVVGSPAAPFRQVKPSFLLQEGVHTIELKIIGLGGLTDTDTVVITVEPEPPIEADAGPDQTVVATNGTTAQVRLDGSNSRATVAWDWALPGSLPDATGEQPLVTLPIGVYTITLTATSPSGSTRIDTVVVTVQKPPAKVTTGPIEGPVGTTMTYGFIGFPNNAAVNIFFVGGGNSVLAQTVSASAVGVANGTVAVPALTGGFKEVRFVINGTIIAQSSFKVTPKITVTPATAQRGQPVTIAITGFAAAEALRIQWRINGSFVQIGSGSSNGFGSAGGTLPVPAGVSLGTNTVRAEGTVNSVQTSSVTIVSAESLAATATLTPSRTTVNVAVAYTLTNFPPNATVSIGFRKSAGSPLDLGVVQTNATGGASGIFLVPATPGGGGQSIRFTAGDVSASAAFEVAPRIKVTTAGAPGQVVDVSLRGYGKGETVLIRWKVGDSYVTVGSVTTSNSGSANTTVMVPLGAVPGNNSVRGEGPLFRAQTNLAPVVGA